MKKTQNILGLPIISISDGVEVGKVKSIIINADRGAIDYIVVDSGIQIFSARVIPTEDVLGIGEYALTIENEGVITDINKVPAAIQLLQSDIRVKGTKVLTKKGRLIGEIGDIFIDDNDNCKITGLEFIADITQKQVRIIPRESVITFGKNLTVVKEDVESSLLDTPSQLDTEAGIPDFEKKNNLNIKEAESIFEETAIASEAFFDSKPFEAPLEVEEQVALEPELLMTEPLPEPDTFVTEPLSEPEAEIQPESEGDSASALFEQRQRQYLRGRYATKTIYDNAGNIIISEGMQIDDRVIDEAKAKNKMIELVLNNRV
ncbi:MAG: PRC-barrel domain-containing protein [Bacillota bacterium]